MKKKGKVHKNPSEMKEKLVRKHRKTILLNDMELDALIGFCKKYNIRSQAKFCREAIISTILKRMEEDHPKLF